jgi:hypothetical protein
MNVVLNERPARIPLQAACNALGLNRSSDYTFVYCLISITQGQMIFADTTWPE